MMTAKESPNFITMATIIYAKIKSGFFSFIFIVFIINNFMSGVIFAQTSSPEATSQNTPREKNTSLTDDSDYSWKGRNDPFMPFITEETLKAEREALEKKLVGLQRFEPGQLSLVAIVFKNGIPAAMVQDSAGKGYIIKEGTKIGRSGVVENISAKKVLIKEEIPDLFSKKKKYNTIQMVLRKEGER